MLFLEEGKQAAQRGIQLIIGIFDLIPGQGFRKRTLTDIILVIHGRKNDIRYHATVLGAVAGNTVKFGMGQFYLPLFKLL